MNGNEGLKVYIVRHGYAGHADPSRWPDDSARPLTEDGIKKFRAAATGLRRLVPGVDSVLSSGYARAWATAEILQEAAGWPKPEECEALEADRVPSTAIEVLQKRDEQAVALVGHDPHLSTLTSLLCSGSEQFRLKLKKGGVAVVRIDGTPAPGAGCLLWAVGPKFLRALDGAT